MGQCCSVLAATTMPLPTPGPTLNTSEISRIIGTAGVNVGCQYKDAKYVTINLADFKRFANAACVFGTKYKLEGNDCDDHAFVFLGRAREYYARTASDCGTLFGYLDGDIKMSANDPTRAHAVCWFIDESKQFYVYDPMWNNIYPFEKWMTAWSIVV